VTRLGEVRGEQLKLYETLVNLMKDNYFYHQYNTALIDKLMHDDFDMRQLPILEKQTVQMNYDNLCSNKSNVRTITNMTSGTTGMPLKVSWTLDDYTKSNFYTWNLRKKWYHIYPSDKYCTFHSVTGNYLADMLIENGGRTLSLGRFIYSDEVIDEYIKAMKEFQPKWILGQPSIIYILGKYLKENDINIESLQYIELNGEFVTDGMMNAIRDQFNVTIGNLYGSTEFNGIAFLCPYGKMHIIENNVNVENKKENTMSELLITGLTNSYMPLIRYNIGDIGLVKDSEECKCGLCSKTLELSMGREKEIIYCQKMNINPSIFSNIVNEMNSEYDVILRYCLDVKPEKFILELLINPQYMEYAKIHKGYMERKLATFNIKYEIKLITDLNELLEPDSKFTYIRNISNCE
jgi:phenylacetate-CoA ligase